LPPLSSFNSISPLRTLHSPKSPPHTAEATQVTTENVKPVEHAQNEKISENVKHVELNKNVKQMENSYHCQHLILEIHCLKRTLHYHCQRFLQFFFHHSQHFVELCQHCFWE
jgi:hypothetical protein